MGKVGRAGGTAHQVAGPVFIPVIGIPYFTIVYGSSNDGYRPCKVSREEYESGVVASGMIVTCSTCRRAIVTAYRAESGPGIDSCGCNTASEESTEAVDRLKAALHLRAGGPVAVADMDRAIALLAGRAI